VPRGSIRLPISPAGRSIDVFSSMYINRS
jgi:hypothetical protein